MKLKAPVQTVGGLLINPRGKVLLGLRARHKRVAAEHWDIIGGHVEPGENPEDALVREILEELGVRPIHFRLLNSFVEPSDGVALPTVHHVYSITAWEGGSPRNACNEHTEIRWFTISEIRGLSNKTPFDFEDLYARAVVDAAVSPRGSSRS